MGYGKACYGAAVEVVAEGDEFVAAGCADGEFHGGFVCFCAGVAEKYFCHAGGAGDFFGEFGLSRDVVEVGAVDEFLCLAADGFYDFWVAVAGGADGDACDEVEVFVLVFVEDV